MRFRHELTYDAAPDEVFEMLSDADFRRQSCAAMAVISAQVQLERHQDGDGFTLEIDQLQNTADLPAFARAFAGDSTQAIQREVWRTRSEGSLEIESPGTPSSAKGTIRLEPAGTSTIEVVEIEIKVKVPLIGGKLEKLMAGKVAAGMEVEHAVGEAWLAR